MKPKHAPLWLLVAGFLLLCGSYRPAQATSPAEVSAGVAAAETAAPLAVTTAKHAAAVPLAASQVLCLPLGAAQLALSPLPGVTAVGGLANIGRGLMAPFKTGMAALRLPMAMAQSLGSLFASASIPTGTGYATHRQRTYA